MFILIDLSENIAENMKDLILKYYTNDDCVINIKYDDINKLKETENLKEILFELLSSEDEIINIIGLTLIIDLNLNYESIVVMHI